MKFNIHNLHSSPGTPYEEQLFNEIVEIVRKGEYLSTDVIELLVLRGHMAVEYYLEKIISNFLPGGVALVKNNDFTFSKKLALVNSFNLVDSDTLEFVKKLNLLRNKCAHKLSYKVSSTDVHQLTLCFSQEIRMIHAGTTDIEILRSLIISVLLDLAYNTSHRKAQGTQNI